MLFAMRSSSVLIFACPLSNMHSWHCPGVSCFLSNVPLLLIRSRDFVIVRSSLLPLQCAPPDLLTTMITCRLSLLRKMRGFFLGEYWRVVQIGTIRARVQYACVRACVPSGGQVCRRVFVCLCVCLKEIARLFRR